jgi:hypothetical protein
MIRIVSRLLLRVAILAASLAWAGFVVTQTIGDPQRGERIATAVLADDAARAEVSAPITAAVLRTTALPIEQRPLVAEQVERVLRDPAGAQTFIDPFAGSWARMLGEDDPRPAELDLVTMLEQLAPTLPQEAVGPAQTADRLPVAGVPLPRVQLDWMSGVRSAIGASVVPLALVAVGAFAVAFSIGDRRRVLRRAGVWAVAAGLAWVVIPPVVVWAARRWTPGADAVVAVGLDEATSGLLGPSLALVAVGAAGFGLSFAVSPTRAVAGATPRRTTVDRVPTAPAPATATRTMPASRLVTSTQEMPQIAGTGAPDERTVELPTTVRTTPRPAPDESTVDDDRDALWDYYGSS